MLIDENYSVSKLLADGFMFMFKYDDQLHQQKKPYEMICIRSNCIYAMVYHREVILRSKLQKLYFHLINFQLFSGEILEHSLTILQLIFTKKYFF